MALCLHVLMPQYLATYHSKVPAKVGRLQPSYGFARARTQYLPNGKGVLRPLHHVSGYWACYDIKSADIFIMPSDNLIMPANK